MSSRANVDDEYNFITEICGDVFTTRYSLGHCVSADFKMGKGIARAFKEMFGNVNYLRNSRTQPGGLAVIPMNGRYVYYLVTKRKYYHKPTLASLRSALTAMRDHALENGISHVAMPRIGTGLDRLPWKLVKRIIRDVFHGMGIQIVIYYL